MVDVSYRDFWLNHFPNDLDKPRLFELATVYPVELTELISPSAECLNIG